MYALEKNKMVNGEPNARAVQFFLETDVTPNGTVPLALVGDGLLPPDMDGNRHPETMIQPRLSVRRTIVPIMVRHSTQSTFGN